VLTPSGVLRKSEATEVRGRILHLITDSGTRHAGVRPTSNRTGINETVRI
jgi:hypothetical protein